MRNNYFSVCFDNKIKSVKHLSYLIDNEIDAGAKGITLFLGAEYLPKLDALGAYLKTLDLSISGAVFPEIIYEGNYYKDGAIVIAWNQPIQVKTFQNISHKNSELYTQSNSDKQPSDVEGCLLFVDAKAKSLEGALDALYYRNEFDYSYAGGGAGYLTDEKKPCIFTQDGVIEDALQAVSLPLHQNNKLGHGWSILSGPHLVTEASDNRLKALDYLPIKEQYPHYIQSKINEDISSKSIKELMADYPIGIKHYGEEIIVRDPFRFHNGAIEFMGNIPEFSNVYILSGEPESLLGYVENNLNKLKMKTKPTNNLSMVFSCVGRRAHMGTASDIEISKISKALKPSDSIIGSASLGELVTNQAGLLRLHNMSLVVSRLYQ